MVWELGSQDGQASGVANQVRVRPDAVVRDEKELGECMGVSAVGARRVEAKVRPRIKQPPK